MTGTRIGRLRRVGVITGAVTALLVGLGITVAVNAQAAAGCRVAYSTASQWPGGFNGNVAITNLGDPINGWSLVWTFPSGQRVTQAW
jgi:endoglucanase